MCRGTFFPSRLCRGFNNLIGDCVRPRIQKLAVQGRQTAAKTYGIKEGWVAHHVSNLYGRGTITDGSWGVRSAAAVLQALRSC